MRSNHIITSSLTIPKRKISGRRRRKLLALLASVVCFTLFALATIYCYWRLLASSSHDLLPSSPRDDAATAAAYHSPAALQQHRREEEEEEGEEVEGGGHRSSMRGDDGRRRPRPRPPTQRNMPYIGEERFEEVYSSKYKGVLPSSSSSSSSSSLLRRREVWTSPDPSCGERPDFFDFFKLPKSDRSRFHEDKIIYDLFKNTTPPSSPNEVSPLPYGTYVELGAFDGRDESNTRFFDLCLGWDGLLIEGQSESYRRVIENRPRAVKLSFSPTCAYGDDNNGTAKFYDYPLSNNGMEGLARSYEGKGTIDVPCGPLTPVLLDVFGPGGKISFLSLDVEGAELMVLRTLDFGVLSIDVVMVEIQNTYCPEANCPNVHMIRGHMASTGKYALFVDFLEASDVYVRYRTAAWMRAKNIETKRRIDLEWEMHDREERERRQLIG